MESVREKRVAVFGLLLDYLVVVFVVGGWSLKY